METAQLFCSDMFVLFLYAGTEKSTCLVTKNLYVECHKISSLQTHLPW